MCMKRRSLQSADKSTNIDSLRNQTPGVARLLDRFALKRLRVGVHGSDPGNDFPQRFQERDRELRCDFWEMLRRFAGRVPFVEDLIAAYYCVMDPATPMRGAAFFLPLLPIRTSSAGPPLALFQKIPGLGFTDDAAVPAAVFGILRILLPSIERPPQEQSLRSFRERMGRPEPPNCRDPTRFMASATWDLIRSKLPSGRMSALEISSRARAVGCRMVRQSA